MSFCPDILSVSAHFKLFAACFQSHFIIDFHSSFLCYEKIKHHKAEYGSGGIVSTMGDVYSYGVMLMETFTRKKPTDEMFTEELSLKNWVKSSAADNVIEIVDANLLSEDDNEHFAATQVCVSSIMILALECTTDSPEERTSMNDVAARLKKIRMEL